MSSSGDLHMRLDTSPHDLEDPFLGINVKRSLSIFLIPFKCFIKVMNMLCICVTENTSSAVIFLISETVT